MFNKLKDCYLVKKDDCEIIETDKDGIITKEARLKSGKYIWREVINKTDKVNEIEQAIVDKQSEIDKLKEEKTILISK
jgi:hypothetical protein